MCVFTMKLHCNCNVSLTVLIADIIRALHGGLDARWREFGVFLHVKPHILNVISSHQRDVSDCMLDLVEKWLRHYDGTGDLPRTWQTVVTAVKNLGYRQLAGQLANEYGT